MYLMRLGTLIFGLIALVSTAGIAVAQERGPVVVELYTSQGCSSCPPADAFLDDLADRDGILALALHVDYWDYIGWADIFADPRYTARQKAYARANGTRSVYTPQMIVDGVHLIAGARAMQVAQSIFGEREEAQKATIAIDRDGGTLSISISPLDDAPSRADIHLVRYMPEATVTIERGENAGKTIRYRNIVTEWTSLGTWDGGAPLSIERDITGDDPVAVILQEPGPGRVIASALLR